MADDKEQEGELELDNSGKKKKMMIIIIAVVVLLGGGGGAYFFLMGDSEPAPSETTSEEVSEGGEPANEETEAEAEGKQGSALYVPMPRPFRLNIPGAVRDRSVEIRVQLLVRGGSNEENAKMHIPLIESTLLGVFSRANADDLATSAGKVALKQQALAAVQQEMKELEGKKTVDKVLFTGFVMQ